MFLRSTLKSGRHYELKQWQKKLNSSRSMSMKLSEFMEVYFEDKQNELKDRTMKNKRYGEKSYCLNMGIKIM